MKVVLEKELDISELYDNVVWAFEENSACETIGLTAADVTPKLMAQVFSALASEAIKRQSEEG